MNVRLEGGLATRLRGGSFTGISAASRPSSIVYRDRVLTFSANAVTATRVGDSTDTSFDSDVSDPLRPALFQFSDLGNEFVVRSVFPPLDSGELLSVRDYDDVACLETSLIRRPTRGDSLQHGSN